MIGYYPANMKLWQGRVDDENDYHSFRWHQIIKQLDFNLPIHKAADDHLSFVLIGYMIDEGITNNIGRAGAKQGPIKVREFLCNKACSFSEKIQIYDGGNIIYVSSVEQAQKTLDLLVTLCLENNYFPIVIGGGHDLSYGTMSSLINHFDIAQENFGIINFDAHFDLRPYNHSTSGTMFRQIYDDIKQKNAPFNYLTIGVQKSSNTLSLFDFVKKINSEYILAGDFTHENYAINIYRLKQFMNRQKNIYVCICCDVFASAYAPGVSNPQPLGVEPELAIDFLKTILASEKVVAFDIAEISPQLDTSNNTASLGALIVYSVINYLGEIKYPHK